MSTNGVAHIELERTGVALLMQRLFVTPEDSMLLQTEGSFATSATLMKHRSRSEPKGVALLSIWPQRLTAPP